MIVHLARGETVHLLLRDDAEERRALRLLRGRHDPLRLVPHRFDTADVWIRDYGPLFVRTRRGLRILDWRFNAWGGKYAALLRDDRMPEFAAERLGLPLDRVDVVLEGGSVDFDGRGTVLTTEQCLLHPNRNPGLDRAGVEAALRGWFGARRVIWLGRGIEGDDTDGHVDDVARFVAPRTVVACVEPDPADPNHGVLEDNLARLRAARDALGRRLRVIPLPMPEPLEEANPVPGHEAARSPASYANFYVANGVVLVPVFRQRRDAAALRVLRRAFPGRRVVGIDCRAVVGGNGALHCVTQQQPRG
jgi:agmatine deiminase